MTLEISKPTLSEAGVPNAEVHQWFAVLGPAGMPPAIVQKLNAVVNKGMQSPEVVRHFINNGLEPATSTPAALRELIATELQVWQKVIRDARISVNAL